MTKCAKNDRESVLKHFVFKTLCLRYNNFLFIKKTGWSDSQDECSVQIISVVVIKKEPAIKIYKPNVGEKLIDKMAGSGK